MFFYSRKHDSHGIGTILQEGNLHSVHIVGQFLDVCLQLCKSCKRKDEEIVVSMVCVIQLCFDSKESCSVYFIP